MNPRRIAEYFVLIIIAVFGSLVGFAQAVDYALTNLRFPTLDLPTVLSIASFVIAVAGLAYISGKDRKLGKMSQVVAVSSPLPTQDNPHPPTLSVEVVFSHPNLRDLREQFPTVYFHLRDYPSEFLSRSAYLQWAKLLDGEIRIQSLTIGGRDRRIQSQVKKDIRKLAVPIVKARRKYRLNLRERLLDLLGFFP